MATAITSAPVILSAKVSDDAYGDDGYGRPNAQAITRVEYSLDLPFDHPNATPRNMTASDGVFDSIQENVTAQIVAPPTVGRHAIYMRGCDSSNACGPVSALWLNVVNGKQVYLPIGLK